MAVTALRASTRILSALARSLFFLLLTVVRDTTSMIIRAVFLVRPPAKLASPQLYAPHALNLDLLLTLLVLVVLSAEMGLSSEVRNVILAVLPVKDVSRARLLPDGHALANLPLAGVASPLPPLPLLLLPPILQSWAHL